MRTRSVGGSAVQRTAGTLAALACAMGLGSGCGSSDERIPTGSAMLEWQVAARDCARADVETVRVEIDGGWSNERGVSAWDFPCDVRRAAVDDLAPGRYLFVLSGLSADGERRFSGRTEQVEVRSDGVVRPGTVVLEAMRSSLRVEWNFGGPFCAHVGVDEVELIAFDSWGSAIDLVRETCDRGGADLELRPGEYDIALFGLSANGMLLYHHVFESRLEAGTKHSQHVTLTAVGD